MQSISIFPKFEKIFQEKIIKIGDPLMTRPFVLVVFCLFSSFLSTVGSCLVKERDRSVLVNKFELRAEEHEINNWAYRNLQGVFHWGWVPPRSENVILSRELAEKIDVMRAEYHSSRVWVYYQEENKMLDKVMRLERQVIDRQMSLRPHRD